MTRLLEWLLGLEQIRLDRDAPLSLRLLTPPAPWILAAGLVVAIVLVTMVYRRENVRGPARWLLAFCRLAAILWVMGLTSRPVLVLSRNHVDPSCVVVLVDASYSMAGMQRGGGPAARLTRWQAADAALWGPGGLVARLAPTQDIALWSFAEQPHRAERVQTPADLARGAAALRAIRPEGPRTDLGAALTAVLDAARGTRMAGVVVLSDGRQTTGTSIETALAEAMERRVPIHAVALGSSAARRDVIVQSVWSDSEALTKDLVSVQGRLTAHGYDRPVRVVIELRDDRSQALLASAPADLNPAPASTEVSLAFRPETPGVLTLRLSAVSRDDEEDAENNAGRTTLRVHEQKLRVLYVESEPRFEYRYLKNTLVRESTLETSILLLSAARGFAQEGTHPIRRFPTSPEELNAYHVVILGDVDPRGEWIGPDQWRLLSEFVATRGGGLCFIAGERAMPFRLRNTPLEKLLPVRIDPRFFGRYENALSEPFTPQLTPAGERHALFRFGAVDAAAEIGSAAGGALAGLPGWYWHAQVSGAAPGAETLAEHPAARHGDAAVPLVVVGRYGAGRTLYVGSDDAWRWRRGRGEGYYDAWWLETVRMLGRPCVLGAQQHWRFEAEQRDNELGRPVRLRLTAIDAAAAAGVEHVAARVSSATGEPIAALQLARLSPGLPIFEAEWLASREGGYVAAAQPADDSRDAAPPGTVFNVRAADAERRDPTADHGLLRQLAERTGGRVVGPEDASALAAAIPDRSVLIPDDVTESLWDSRLALLLFVLPVVLEWIVRKAKSLA